MKWIPLNLKSKVFQVMENYNFTEGLFLQFRSRLNHKRFKSLASYIHPKTTVLFVLKYSKELRIEIQLEKQPQCMSVKVKDIILWFWQHVWQACLWDEEDSLPIYIKRFVLSSKELYLLSKLKNNLTISSFELFFKNKF